MPISSCAVVLAVLAEQEAGEHREMATGGSDRRRFEDPVIVRVDGAHEVFDLFSIRAEWLVRRVHGAEESEQALDDPAVALERRPAVAPALEIADEVVEVSRRVGRGEWIEPAVPAPRRPEGPGPAVLRIRARARRGEAGTELGPGRRSAAEEVATGLEDEQGEVVEELTIDASRVRREARRPAGIAAVEEGNERVHHLEALAADVAEEVRHGEQLRGDSECGGVATGERQDLGQREPEVGDDGDGEGLRGKDRHQETRVGRPCMAMPERSARARQAQGATRRESTTKGHRAKGSGSQGGTITKTGRRMAPAITGRSARRSANP